MHYKEGGGGGGGGGEAKKTGTAHARIINYVFVEVNRIYLLFTPV